VCKWRLVAKKSLKKFRKRRLKSVQKPEAAWLLPTPQVLEVLLHATRPHNMQVMTLVQHRARVACDHGEREGGAVI